MARLLVNKNIWVLDHLDGLQISDGPCLVLGFRQFLPAGMSPSGFERKQSLIQIWTDVGMRTLAVASVWGKDPSRNSRPW